MLQSDVDNLVLTLYVFAFAFGASWGSFLNVVIYRLPLHLSVISPPSHCPACKTPIRAYDNIPLLSWLLLRARCRTCDVKISPRYFGVELLVALLSLPLAVHVLDGRVAAVLTGRIEFMALFLAWSFLFVFIVGLVALFFIDLDITELPPELTIPGIVLGLLYAYLLPTEGFFFDLVPNPTLVNSLLGASIGGGLILGLIVVYYLLTGRIGMGGGDIWMMAMVGAFVGWQGLFFIFLASSVQGIVVALGAVGVAKFRGEESGLFRNNEVDALESQLGLGEQESEPPPGSETPESEAADAAGDEAIIEAAAPLTDADAVAPAAAEALAAAPVRRPIGKFAIPFGPFIAVSAIEYMFIGEWFLSLLTHGVLHPNG